MNIVILHGIQGARDAQGVAVVIDVFRAFTTACHAIAAGACPLLPADSLDQALAIKQTFPDAVLAGERFAKPLPGCDFGNSPALLEKDRHLLGGRPFIQATHAGTRGLLAATAADVVLAASLVNARATAEYIRQLNPSCVSLVPMGWAGEDEAEEDSACAEYIRALLQGSAYDTSRLAESLRNAAAAEKFFAPDQPWAPEQDFTLCLDVDRFPFALRLVPGPPAILSPVVVG